MDRGWEGGKSRQVSKLGRQKQYQTHGWVAGRLNKYRKVQFRNFNRWKRREDHTGKAGEWGGKKKNK